MNLDYLKNSLTMSPCNIDDNNTRGHGAVCSRVLGYPGLLLNYTTEKRFRMDSSVP